MKLETAQFIIKACENADTFFQDFEEDAFPKIYTDYLFNGYDKPTTGIVTSNVMAVMAAIATELLQVDYYKHNDFNYDAVPAEMAKFRMNSLGLNTIIY